MDRDVYFLADLRDASVQRQTFARAVARQIPRFDAVVYPDWSTLLEAWRDRAPAGGVLAIDELPYLVQVSPELPSVLQRLLDTPSDRPLRMVLCGSSQRMMHGLALDRSAPLYGRAREILKIEPLAPQWLKTALRKNDREAVEAYAVWGGLPRNWELAADFSDTEKAVKALILDKNGILHAEPPRLLLDDMRSAVQAATILSLIGVGCHRIGEIAARMQRPVTSLTRPLALLVDLGYVRREVPFGESPLSSKRSVYKLADPFQGFWYRFVQPNESLLEMDLVEEVHRRIREELPAHVAGVWEQLARSSVPKLPVDEIAWGPASRWWGTDLSGKTAEIDVVAQSLDGKHILIGEASWSSKTDTGRRIAELRGKAARLPFARDKALHFALWLKEKPETAAAPIALFGPADTLPAV